MVQLLSEWVTALLILIYISPPFGVLILLLLVLWVVLHTLCVAWPLFVFRVGCLLWEWVFQGWPPILGWLIRGGLALAFVNAMLGLLVAFVNAMLGLLVAFPTPVPGPINQHREHDDPYAGADVRCETCNRTYDRCSRCPSPGVNASNNTNGWDWGLPPQRESFQKVNESRVRVLPFDSTRSTRWPKAVHPRELNGKQISSFEIVDFRPKGGYPATIRLKFTDGSIYDARVPMNPVDVHMFNQCGVYESGLPTRANMHKACVVYAGETSRDSLRGKRIMSCEPIEVVGPTIRMIGGDPMLGVGFRLEGCDSWHVLYGAQPDGAGMLDDTTYYFDSQCPLYLARLRGPLKTEPVAMWAD
ncbi:hypothetical protein OE88DRAFT_1649524 [Heliocybe sulcata]|uniref:Uncharacterized protein n=1 Tax=Heliocybe sulcata TaxID=5364 RepID=A0A5C3NHE3_9AGAM|nr:hypothetical protein OE88DRAFT_1649524 [Heliocybe sulcata]